MLHKACKVYMLLPSAVRQSTRRAGQATAAPTASGRAMPIEPPVFPSQSCGGDPIVAAILPRPEVMASSTTIAFSGTRAPTPPSQSRQGDFAARPRRAFCLFCQDRLTILQRQLCDERLQRADIIFAGSCERVDFTFR